MVKNNEFLKIEIVYLNGIILSLIMFIIGVINLCFENRITLNISIILCLIGGMVGIFGIDIYYYLKFWGVTLFLFCILFIINLFKETN